MKESTKFALSFLGGAAAGIGIGLLFAPQTGEETREDVKKWLGETKEKGRDILAKGKEEFSVKKEHLGAAFNAGKKAYVEAVHNHKETVGV